MLIINHGILSFVFCCRILGEEDYVAVLFYEEKKRESMKALQHLEMIDDEADIFGIRYGRRKQENLKIRKTDFCGR